MELNSTCARCGGSHLEAGDLIGQRKVTFRPFSAPSPAPLFFGNVTINVEAAICLDCGNIQLTGDAARLREILKK